MRPDIRVLLIGGTSHTGKSTLANGLAERLAADVLSTDYLARHPGRPWSAPAERSSFVIAHYRDLSVQQLMQSALAHYERVWDEMIEPRLRDQRPDRHLIVEGSAVLPARAARLAVGGTSAVWLLASEHLLRRRVRAESGYDELTAADHAPVDKFLDRAIAFNHWITDQVARLGLPSIEVDGFTGPDLQDLLMAQARPLSD